MTRLCPLDHQNMDAAQKYYEWARTLIDPAEKAAATLELCHMLILAMESHKWFYHPPAGEDVQFRDPVTGQLDCTGPAADIGKITLLP